MCSTNLSQIYWAIRITHISIAAIYRCMSFRINKNWNTIPTSFTLTKECNPSILKSPMLQNWKGVDLSSVWRAQSIHPINLEENRLRHVVLKCVVCKP